MPPALPSRLLPALAVLGLHALMFLLLLRAMPLREPSAPAATSVLLLRPEPAKPPPAALQVPQAPPERPVLRVPLPEFSVRSDSPLQALPQSEPATPATAGAPAASAPAPLNLALPPPAQRTRLPAIAEQLRHDPRANTPMRSADERMAEALGSKGWTVTDLGEGSKMVRGPFGECSIIRPSMVDGIAGHPHAGLLPNRSFPCGGIEKGSLQHARPHERKR